MLYEQETDAKNGQSQKNEQEIADKFIAEASECARTGLRDPDCIKNLSIEMLNRWYEIDKNITTNLATDLMSRQDGQAIFYQYPELFDKVTKSTLNGFFHILVQSKYDLLDRLCRYPGVVDMLTASTLDATSFNDHENSPIHDLFQSESGLNFLINHPQIADQISAEGLATASVENTELSGMSALHRLVVSNMPEASTLLDMNQEWVTEKLTDAALDQRCNHLPRGEQSLREYLSSKTGRVKCSGFAAGQILLHKVQKDANTAANIRSSKSPTLHAPSHSIWACAANKADQSQRNPHTHSRSPHKKYNTQGNVEDTIALFDRDAHEADD